MDQYIPSSEQRNLGRYRLLCLLVLHFEIMWEQTGWKKCTSSSLRKGHRIKCQCTTGKDNPWALSTQFNLNPGQTVKSRDTVCSHSRVYGQNICRFSFFLILKGFRNVLKHRLLPGTHPHPCANCHSSGSMKQLEAGTSCSG